MTGNRHDFCPTCGASYPRHHLGCPRYGAEERNVISAKALFWGALLSVPIWAVIVTVWANWK